MHNHSADEAIAALAGRQHGVVSLTQLRALGLSDVAVRRRVETGRLHRLHRAVYAVGHTALTMRSRELAAVFACGPEAVLSHRSAARLWGLVRSAPRVEVTSRRSRSPGSGIVVHRSDLATGERAAIDGIPVTTPNRTITDIADSLTEPQLRHAIHEAEVRRLFDLNHVHVVPGRRGSHRLASVLSAWTPPQFTRNEAERRFLRLCERHGLRTPLANARVGGYEVDFHWPDARLVVEVDGAAAHHTRRNFESDRRRDRVLAALGVQVVRVTWLDLTGDGARLARQIEAILRARIAC